MSTQGFRDVNIDAARGFAFFAVILVNLLTEFRVPILLYFEKFHTEPGILNHTVDWVVGTALDQKGFTMLSFLFGIGIGLMAEKHAAGIQQILFRRFLFLFGLGIIHILFIFSGDILLLYSVCGICLALLVKARASVLVSIVIGLFGVRYFVEGFSVPLHESSQEIIESAHTVYRDGGFFEVIQFRIYEIQHVIGPLLINIVPRALAVMLLGLLAQRTRFHDNVRSGRVPSKLVVTILIVGALLTSFDAYLSYHGIRIARWNLIIADFGVLALAFGYLLSILKLNPSNHWVVAFAALGRMSLTTYLSQTILLGILFYGYGFGLFGTMGSWAGFLIGASLLTAQVFIAVQYFKNFTQGPIESVWRKFTYASWRQKIVS